METWGLTTQLKRGCQAADTIILLDFALVRCAWRALRRGRERSDFWRCLIRYRSRSLPLFTQEISKFAPHAELHLIRNPEAATPVPCGSGKQPAKHY